MFVRPSKASRIGKDVVPATYVYDIVLYLHGHQGPYVLRLKKVIQAGQIPWVSVFHL